MRVLPILYVLGLLLALASCKKTEAPSGIDDPVFIMGLEGLDSLGLFTAGLEDIYLYTSFTSNNGVFKSTNCFSKVGCETGDCPGSLCFEFKEAVTMDAPFAPGKYLFSIPSNLLGTINLYDNAFLRNDNFRFKSITLSLIDTQSTIKSAETTYFTQKLYGIKYLVNVTGIDTSNAVTQLSRCIVPGAPKDTLPGVRILASPIGSTYLLTAISTGTTIIDYLWSNGNASEAIEIDSLFVQGTYCVTVTDDNDNTASACISNLPLPDQGQILTADFNVESQIVDNDLQPGTIAIQWVDATGLVWRSDFGMQPSASRFNVLSNEDYEPNEKGDRTQKLIVQFNCVLFTDSGQQRDVNGWGTVAMARPK